MTSVLHIATYAHGGAAIAMRRLNAQLAGRGVSSSVAAFFDYAHCDSWERHVAQIHAFADKMTFRYSKQWDGSYFSPAVVPSCGRLKTIPLQGVIHAHWLEAGALRIEEFSRLPGPLIWSLHDEWLYTGGCHSGKDGCVRYLTGCGSCPVLGSGRENDLSRMVWRRKEMVWPHLDLAAIVAPSRWIAERAEKSPLLAGRRIEIIPNPIDTNVFSPMPQREAREHIGVPQDKKVLFFAGGVRRDPVRGIDLLEEALTIAGKRIDAVLCVIGAPFSSCVDFGRISVHPLPVARDDETMRSYYTAADVTLMPSRIANLSNTLIESLACGTPTVAFAVGGNPEIVDHRESGYLATPGDARDLAEGIEWVLIRNEANVLGELGRERLVERFSAERVIPRFLALYEEIAAVTEK